MRTQLTPSYTKLLTMPKVELHVHLEGAIQPATLLALARQHSKLDQLPGHDEVALRKWFRFTDFRHFIEIYSTISDLLRTPDDFAMVTKAFGAEMARQHVRYAEVTITPHTHTHLLDKGLTIADILEGLSRGRHQAKVEHGVDLVWIFDIARNVSFHSSTGKYDPRVAEITLEYALAGRDHGVIGLGLGGNEAGAPPGPFSHVFEEAIRQGLYSLPHAGELDGPKSVWGAIHALHAQRIGHGVRSIEDPFLLTYLKHHQIPLELNLTSNQCLHVYPRLANHPFPHLDRMGLMVTINSDDPPLFNTDLTHEYCVLIDQFGYSLVDVARIGRNAMFAAMITDSHRQALLAELDAWTQATIG